MRKQSGERLRRVLNSVRRCRRSRRPAQEAGDAIGASTAPVPFLSAVRAGGLYATASRRPLKEVESTCPP